jgi:hypothetical protein
MIENKHIDRMLISERILKRLEKLEKEKPETVPTIKSQSQYNTQDKTESLVAEYITNEIMRDCSNILYGTENAKTLITRYIEDKIYNKAIHLYRQYPSMDYAELISMLRNKLSIRPENNRVTNLEGVMVFTYRQMFDDVIKIEQHLVNINYLLSKSDFKSYINKIDTVLEIILELQDKSHFLISSQLYEYTLKVGSLLI